MADNINLLPEQSDIKDGKSKQNALINKISATILVVTIIAVAGVFGVNFFLGQSIAGLDAQAMEQKTLIDEHQEAEGIYRSLASRLEAAGQFLNTQNHYSRALVEISKTLPASIRFENLAISADKSVTISGTSTAYGDLAGFLAKLKAAGGEASPYFIEPVITTINRPAQSDPIEFNASFKLNSTLVVGQTATGTN